MNLHDKTILLTGATGGIGREIAALLSQEWANLILVGKDHKKLKILTQSLHGRHTTIAADLSRKNGRARLLKILKRKRLKVDILVSSAGIGIYKKSSEFSEKDWYDSYELNVHTPFFLWQSLQPQLTVNLGSCSALQYKANRSLYNSTKAALRSLTLCLENEYPGELVHLTLDSTLTGFGSLTLTEKKTLAAKGKKYLDPVWVARNIISIIKQDSRNDEYVLSPDCYEGCGTWQKP